MIKEKKFTIGRSRKCDIILADDSVSRVHAELICLKDGGLFVTDCHSINGTVLIKNGREKSIGQEFLSKDDVLQLGDVRMSVRELLDAIPGKLKFLDICKVSDTLRRRSRSPGSEETVWSGATAVLSNPRKDIVRSVENEK